VSLWRDFHSRFRKILDNLERNRDLMEFEVSLVDIENARMVRDQAEQRFNEHRDKERRRRMISVVEWLAPVDTNSDQDRCTEVRWQYPGTANWILTERTVKAWQNSSLAKDAGTWIYGIPGAGM
jgi:hypothetical protein